MNVAPESVEHVKSCINRQRLVETARRLIDVPSPTGAAAAVSDRLAEILTAEGFEVERPTGGYPESPAVVIRLDSGRPGRTLQFNGHLDTVHLPFVPSEIKDGRLTGSGASDMKGGLAAAVEAVRALRDSGALTAGVGPPDRSRPARSPWGDGRQLDQLIREGLHGDAVLLPEPLRDVLPIAGRGSATWKVTIRRAGPPVHEVMRPQDEPSVIAAGAELVARLGRLDQELAATRRIPICGAASVFIGQIPRRRNLQPVSRNRPGSKERGAGCRVPMPAAVERDFRAGSPDSPPTRGRAIDVRLDLDSRRVRSRSGRSTGRGVSGLLRATRRAQLCPRGPSRLSTMATASARLAGVPAITHGPRAGGQHTLAEWVEIDDLVRVALALRGNRAGFLQPAE